MKKIIILSVFLWMGCGSASSLSDLDIGMNKHSVKSAMGSPTVRGAIQNKYGQMVEVWEYTLWRSMWSPERDVYWLYIVDGKLAQWGRAGDWSREADAVYEMRFR